VPSLVVSTSGSEAEPLVEVTAGPAGGEAEAPEPDETATVKVSHVAKHLNPGRSD